MISISCGEVFDTTFEALWQRLQPVIGQYEGEPTDAIPFYLDEFVDLVAALSTLEEQDPITLQRISVPGLAQIAYGDGSMSRVPFVTWWSRRNIMTMICSRLKDRILAPKRERERTRAEHLRQRYIKSHPDLVTAEAILEMLGLFPSALKVALDRGWVVPAKLPSYFSGIVELYSLSKIKLDPERLEYCRDNAVINKREAGEYLGVRDSQWRIIRPDLTPADGKPLPDWGGLFRVGDVKVALKKVDEQGRFRGPYKKKSTP